MKKIRAWAPRFSASRGQYIFEIENDRIVSVETVIQVPGVTSPQNWCGMHESCLEFLFLYKTVEREREEKAELKPNLFDAILRDIVLMRNDCERFKNKIGLMSAKEVTSGQIEEYHRMGAKVEAYNSVIALIKTATGDLS